MVGNSGVVLQQKYLDKYSFLSDLNIEAGRVTQHIGDGSKVLNYIIAGFIINLALKNSMWFKNNIQFNLISQVAMIIFFISAFSLFSQVSEFLYFNF